MKSFLQFFKTTIVGGILYLVPIIALIVVIGKAHEISSKIVTPLAARIPVESVAGLSMARVLAIAAIVLFCFLAGLFAKTDLAKKIVNWVEATILSNLPGYAFMKSMGESMVGIEKDGAYEIVLARIEDAWQIAFLVERMEGGHVAVFVPGAPSPWSGSVYFMTEDRIKPLDIPIKAALSCVKRLGVGSKALLRGRL
jgi:uncharacterized membrane protein